MIAPSTPRTVDLTLDASLRLSKPQYWLIQWIPDSLHRWGVSQINAFDYIEVFVVRVRGDRRCKGPGLVVLVAARGSTARRRYRTPLNRPARSEGRLIVIGGA